MRFSDVVARGESLILRWGSPGVGLGIAVWMAAHFRFPVEGVGLTLGLVGGRKAVQELQELRDRPA